MVEPDDNSTPLTTERDDLSAACDLRAEFGSEANVRRYAFLGHQETAVGLENSLVISGQVVTRKSTIDLNRGENLVRQVVYGA
jgi:hypothetical protein